MATYYMLVHAQACSSMIPACCLALTFAFVSSCSSPLVPSCPRPSCPHAPCPAQNPRRPKPRHMQQLSLAQLRCSISSGCCGAAWLVTGDLGGGDMAHAWLLMDGVARGARLCVSCLAFLAFKASVSSTKQQQQQQQQHKGWQGPGQERHAVPGHIAPLIVCLPRPHNSLIAMSGAFCIL